MGKSLVKKYFVWSLIGLAVSYGFILVNVFGLFPLGKVSFFIFLTAIFFFCFFRPREMFWIFVVTLPFENIIISPEMIPFSVRPFQAVGGLLFLAVVILWLLKKLDFQLLSLKKICIVCQITNREACQKIPPKKAFNFFDRFVFLLPIFGLIAIFNALNRDISIKQTLVLISFVLLYWLARNFLQNRKKIYEVLWFFVIGSEAVILLGLYQAFAQKFGWPAFEVMSGRINSTFSEPDWFGVYLVFLLAIILLLRLVFQNSRNNTMITSWKFSQISQIFLNVYFFFVFLCLFLTVSRSAWLGFSVILFLYYFFQFFSYKFPIGDYQLRYRRILADISITASLLALVIFFAISTNLSSFHIANRAVSTFSGMQKITVSCLAGSFLPEKINSLEQLSQYNCKHIDLEEIEKEKESGFEIREIYRPDPNVEIRKNIYQTILGEIKKHPILGQGLGSSGVILGQDERGMGLNTSNIFLESFFSLGIIGLLIILFLFFYPLYFCGKNIFSKIGKERDLFVVLLILAFLIPNFFNAGLFLGFLWIFWSTLPVLLERE